MRGHLLCRDTFALAPRCPLIRGTTVSWVLTGCTRSEGPLARMSPAFKLAIRIIRTALFHDRYDPCCVIGAVQSIQWTFEPITSRAHCRLFFPLAYGQHNPIRCILILQNILSNLNIHNDIFAKQF